MEKQKKTSLLRKLLERSEAIANRTSSDATFRAWKNTVERVLIRIYGDDSPEVSHFRQLLFFYSAPIMNLGADYSSEHRKAFDRDFDILISSIENYIEEIEDDDENDDQAQNLEPERLGKIFISHASQDKEFVEEIIDLLQSMGLPEEAIFCTSFEGYGIDLGVDFLQTIKEELTHDSLVLFVLTDHFYASPFCLCEMGAAWVLTKQHIPILIPPFDFSDIEGVIPLTQGFKIDDPLKLNLFKEKIEQGFGLVGAVRQSVWERQRDRILDRINEKIAARKKLPTDS